MTKWVDMHSHFFRLLNRGQAQTLNVERPPWLRDNGDGSGFIMAGVDVQVMVDSTRLRTLCQVPLQDIDAACAEAARSCRAGHVGVHIGNHVGGRNLDDPEMVRFLAFCAEQGIPVLVHPWGMMAAERMPRYMLKWLVGMPTETHLAMIVDTAVMGDDHIMMGSDYPFPLGEIEPGRLISDSSHLDVGSKTRMLSGNASRFFGLGLTDV